MATTTPDNIQYPVNSDQVAPLASHFKNLADSTQAALVTKASATGLSDEITDRTDADTALQNQINDIKQTSRIYVKNGSTALTKGTPVYITGANGTNVIVGAASNASEATSSKTIGLLETDLAINAMGYVVTAGLCTNIDTSGAGAAGDPVWLGVNGAKIYGLINKPYAPAHLVYLGVVSKKNGSTGEIEVRVQNGFELDELHNVQINSGTLATGQALTYDGSTQLWKNSTPASSLEDLSDVQITAPLLDRQVLQYDDSVNKFVNVISSGGVTVSSTAPDLATALEGDAWLNDNDGTLFVCLIDTDGTKLWMQVQANSALEASILARLSQLEASAIAYGNPNPNVIINGGFDIWQRGTSGLTATGFLADRWYQITSVNPASARSTITPGTTGIPESIAYALDIGGGTVGTSGYNYINQRIEDVRTLAGKTATLSFYAKGTTAGTIGASFVQSFGSGGSADNWITGSTFAVTTSWQRFTMTVNITSLVGKTIGTAADSFLGLRFVKGLGSSYSPSLVGLTSLVDYTGTLSITGVQVETGSTATSFRRNQPNIQAELAACQRYYYRMTNAGVGTGYLYMNINGNAYSTISAELGNVPPVPMRIAPTSLEFSTLALNDSSNTIAVTNLTLNAPGKDAGLVVATVASGLTQYRHYKLLGNNNNNAYVGFSAEL